MTSHGHRSRYTGTSAALGITTDNRWAPINGLVGAQRARLKRYALSARDPHTRPHKAAQEGCQEEAVLVEQTLEKLSLMKLHGMAKAMRQWLDRPQDQSLVPADLVGLLVDAEWLYRENRKLEQRLKNAKLKQPACIEDIDYAHARNLSKAVMLELASSRWVQSHQNVILTGSTGIGKSWLACALGQKACRDGFSVVYRRVSRLFDETAQARADGTYPHLLSRLAKVQVLILDDFGLETLSSAQRMDLLDVIEDRYQLSSTIITSQLDPNEWHAVIGDATIADAICDRLVHNAHRLRLEGESIRKAENLTKGKKSPK